MRHWIAINIEPLLLGLAIVMIVGVGYGIVEAMDDRRRGR